VTLTEELRKVYDAGYMQGDAEGANTIHPHEAAQAFHDAALRAVFLAGARAQRDAFVDELLEADATWSVKEAQVLADNAMQRVAPLVGE